MNETMRLFVALPLADELVQRLGRLQSRLRADVPERAVVWTRPEQMHLTLVFLGEVAASRTPALRQALDRASRVWEPFELEVTGLGVFPQPRAPRVLWVGLQGGLEPLRRLQESVAAACMAFLEPAVAKRVLGGGQEFNPHLTLGRVRERLPGSTELVARAFKRWRFDEVLNWPVAEVHLLRSYLRPGGAVYESLATWPLNAGGKAGGEA
ncbi:MAG: RNA 2',3'-cyclic phosphodiesterase [Verrucomicrobia bacterium]|nr:MAG: RNA 2',3'-cyclic phosphodiesterase [Verrucomicrobiota bacterium]